IFGQVPPAPGHFRPSRREPSGSAANPRRFSLRPRTDPGRRPTDQLLRALLQLIPHRREERRQMIPHDVPDQSVVDLPIVMGRDVAETGDLLPRDLRVSDLESRTEILAGLGDGFETLGYRFPSHPIRNEGREIHTSREIHDLAALDDDVTEE